MAIGTLPEKGGYLEQVRQDTEEIIRLHGISANLVRENATYGNSGEIVSTNNQWYKIKMMILSQSRKNRQFNSGQVDQGEIEAFFMWKYPKDMTRSSDLIVDVGDKIRDQDYKYWRIEEILKKPEWEGRVAYIKAKLRRIE